MENILGHFATKTYAVDPVNCMQLSRKDEYLYLKRLETPIAGSHNNQIPKHGTTVGSTLPAAGSTSYILTGITQLVEQQAIMQQVPGSIPTPDSTWL